MAHDMAWAGRPVALCAVVRAPGFYYEHPFAIWIGAWEDPWYN